MYFGVEQEEDEHTGLLSAASQDAIEASSTPASPKGRYQGLGRTHTPHSRSAPANLSTTAWDGDVDDITPIQPSDATESPNTDYAPVS